MDGFGGALMWGFLTVLALFPVYGVWLWWDARRSRRQGRPRALSSGGIVGFDEVWRPSAAEAQAVWEAEQIMPAPAPIPGDGPGVIDGGRIIIETGLRPAP
ncbi:hypothetical protein N3K63_11545 [Microbacterium sp. W1N]|uniref:hypothetical protein n=1 Tax=Microbacterium festucae TaxID=2977531 RepID=UPI0021C1AA3C|nr:hypothetical protein [Microbacterium festucae]MCT9820915.1 hypothetical protein [Microbacterium festucae]